MASQTPAPAPIEDTNQIPGGTFSGKTLVVNKQGERLVILTVVIVVAIMVAVFVFAFSYPITPILPHPLAQGADLALILAPIIAAAAGIERFLETLWNLAESYLRSFVAFLAGRSEWLRWANDEWKAARARLDAISDQADATRRVGDLLTSSEDALTVLVERASTDLELAEQRLAGLVNTNQYKDAKRVISILLSLCFGILISTIAGLQMFALLGVNLPARFDIIITGIAIGTGATPVHSLIGILQQTKDTLDGAQSLLKNRSTAVQQQNMR